jgi:hypothetical protein
MIYEYKKHKKRINLKEQEIKVYPISSYKRDKKEEGGNVYRWYENKDSIVSVTEGDFPNEADIRVSYGWEKGKPVNFRIRGSKEIILKKSDEQILRSAVISLEREKYFNKIK